MTDHSDKPIRIQRRRTKGWRIPDNTVCVDRTTGFGSPFPITIGTETYMGERRKAWVVGSWTGPGMWFCDTKPKAIELSVAAFRAWIWQPQQAALREKARVSLRGKNLACWCGDHECHADVLLEIANA